MVVDGGGRCSTDTAMSSDRDESKDISTGAQVLPVAELPVDFSGEVADGAQYLFTVRWVMGL